MFNHIADKDAEIWTSFMEEHVKNNMFGTALSIFLQLLSHIPPCNYNLLCAIKSNGRLGHTFDLVSVRAFFHAMHSKDLHTYNLMINGYMSVGLIHEARCIFNDMSIKNLISWSTMIGGYATNDHPHIALELFRLFKEQGLRADVSIITGICIACSKLGILGVAKSAIQDYVGPSLYSHLPFVAALIQMYGGCGRIEMACKVFEEVSHRDRDLSCFELL